MAKAPKKLQIADFVLGAFYENHNYNGRHVVGQLTGAIENKAVMGRWDTFGYPRGHGHRDGRR